MYLHTTEYDFIEEPSVKNSMYHCMSCVLFVLNKVSEGSGFKRKIIELLDENESINLTEMGFPENWKEQNIWKV